MLHVAISKRTLRRQAVRVRRRSPRGLRGAKRRIRLRRLLPLAILVGAPLVLLGLPGDGRAPRLPEAAAAIPAEIAKAPLIRAPETAPHPAAAAPVARVPAKPELKTPPRPRRPREISGQIGKGSSLLAALQATGLTRESLFELLDAAGKVINFRRCRSGDRYRLLLDPQGRPARLEYYGSQPVVLGAMRRGRKLVPFKEPLRGKKDLEVLRGDVASSLEATVVAAGGTPVLAAKLADLFAWDVDFNVDVRQGDSVAIALERIQLPDGTWRRGGIVAAVYRGERHTYQAFRYQVGKRVGYFDADGVPLRRRYLASPLPFMRVTSRFGRRWHPVLKRLRHHGGIDYGAPRGTPIWAVADGRVAFAGRKGGFGNLVVLRHRDGNRTYYAHMSRFARGLRKGMRVRQKRVIGYVGSTGRSTGPHLHYAVRQGRRFINPKRIRQVRALPLPRRHRLRFRAFAARTAARLNGTAVAMAKPSGLPHSSTQ